MTSGSAVGPCIHFQVAGRTGQGDTVEPISQGGGLRRPERPERLCTLRSRRYRPIAVCARPEKRLFTPDIKRLLKDWLVRRREHPYPSRAEKEALAVRTGLTYMQICNWFANWRRKLRECAGRGAGAEPYSSSWAQLIRRYNARTRTCSRSRNRNRTDRTPTPSPRGPLALERFSISSRDSIWQSSAEGSSSCSSTLGESSDTSLGDRAHTYMSSTKSEDDEVLSAGQSSAQVEQQSSSSDRKEPQDGEQDTESGSALLLSKWLESAARYQPAARPAHAQPCCQQPRARARGGRGGWGVIGTASAAVEQALQGRHKEELDAAEALTFLSSLSVM